MPRTVDVLFSTFRNSNWNGGGVEYVVETLSGVLYAFYINTDDDVVYRKSTDKGLTWSDYVVVFTGTATQLAVWYDRWSGIAADLIHLTYSESVTDDVFYRTVDAASADALSTQTLIFAGASTAANSHMALTRARGGNVYCKVCIDAGAEGGFFRLPNANVPNGAWDAARTINEALATQDQMILMPGFAADNQDIIGLFLDASSNELDRTLYDDSANSWALTNIATGITDLVVSTAAFNFSATPDLANNRLFVICWTNVDTATARLRAWVVTESAITALTDVVASSTDDQGLCGITLNISTGHLYAFYGGASGGGETWPTALNIYYKVSTDAGATWGAEQQLTTEARSLLELVVCPRTQWQCPGVLFTGASTNTNYARYTAPVVQPRAEHILIGA